MDQRQNQVQQLQQIVDDSAYMVFFGGAGVSTESGIPDFRSRDGLYNQHYDVPPETILSHRYFIAHPEGFYRFYREKMLCPKARPNAAHQKLAALERAGKLRLVITQNIDGLHTMAGSRQVAELHGSVHRNYCQNCHRLFDMQFMLANNEAVPHCPCGGVIKPDVVLYEEPLDESTVHRAVSAIAAADTLIVAGTSLTVYPAAGLIRYFQGRRLVLINRDQTQMDRQADLVIRQPVGQTLRQIRV